MAYVQKLFDSNFMEYASYVIKDRAIPNIEDGFKPVQRRILHSLFEMDDGKFHKVANVVGHCMKYHPHGDASIYSALVVLANKDLFIEKQGNFGNIYTGDPASAARYIECRLLPLAKKVLYFPEITDYDDSYDGRNREPLIFPAKIPVVLIQGTEGIAVGMSTRILPHNFVEVLEALKAALKGEKKTLYPDFPTGGIIDVTDYQDGMGKVLVRAKLDTSDPKRIVVRELPFGTTSDTLIASVENAARKGKLKIGSISDYTAENVEIEIKLARGVHTQEVLDALYAFTDCETSISVNSLVIIDNKPVLVPISKIIEFHAGFIIKVLKAELKIEEGRLKDKIHARTLERIFIEERIYKRIEDKKTQSGVMKAVHTGLEPFQDEIRREVTDEDVERLLKIPIRRISLYDIEKARRELQELDARLKEVRANLKDLTGYALGFLDRLIEDHGSAYPRLSTIKSFEKVDVREAAQRDLDLRYDPDTGYLGYGIKTGKVMFQVSPYDRVLVIRKNGSYSVIDVPERLFVDKGMLCCVLAEKERLAKLVFTVLYVDKATRYAYIKRCRIEQYILNKGYTLIPEDALGIKLTTQREKVGVQVSYKPKPRMKILEETFPLEDFVVKGVKAGGVRLAAKEVRSAKFVRQSTGGNGKSGLQSKKAASKKRTGSKA